MPNLAFSPAALRSHRKRLGLSRDVVAFAVGVVTDTVGNWERGFTSPSADKLAALAAFLQCSPSDLFEDASKDAHV